MNTRKVKLTEHSNRAHALLSASGASRWLNCTPSARLEEMYGERATSKFADEGTLAHEIAELILTQGTSNALSPKDYESRLNELKSKSLFDPEMLQVLPTYTDYCMSQYEQAVSKSFQNAISIEEKLDMTDYVPDGFGTADCIILEDKTLEIIDLKYGKGIKVSAENNSQLMLYGLAAYNKWQWLYDINEVRLTIIQPRLDNISSWVISVEDLLVWANEVLKPKAKLAYNGEGEQTPGEWCRFCSIRNRCGKLAEQQMELVKKEFIDASILQDEEIADIVQKGPDFIEWVNSIMEYALKQSVENGKQWPGMKLVEGRSQRKWIDEVDVLSKFAVRFPEIPQSELITSKLKPITAVEKLVGKKRFESEMSDCVIKPNGKPTLVPMDDKRPAMGIEQAKIDFQ